MRSIALLSLLAACIAPGTAEIDDDRQRDDSTEPPPLVSSAATVGPDGGIVEAGGATLTVPPGALQADLVITLEELARDPDDPYVGLSHVWRATPEDAVLDVAVEVALPFTPGVAPTMYWSDGNGGFAAVAEQAVLGGRLIGLLGRLGQGFVSDPLALSETEQFTFEAPRLDVLFVVDNSGSMTEEQSDLIAALPDVSASLLASSLDFHVGVVSTDMDSAGHKGRLQGAGGPLWVDRDTPDPVDALEQMADLGIGGSGDERGLAAVVASHDALGATYNQGFYRDGSQLAVVVVSDENDHSVGSTADFSAWLQTIREPGEASFTSIVLPAGYIPSFGDDGEAGRRYLDVTQDVGGETHDIRNAPFTAALQRALDRTHGMRLELAAEPDPETLAVTVTATDQTILGLERDVEWIWDADLGLVELLPTAPVADGDTVRVSYTAQ